MSIKTAIKLASAVLCLLILFVPLASADETTKSFIVYTEKKDYVIGEPVNIYVKAEAMDPNHTITVTDVIVYDPNNMSVAEWHNLSIVLTDTTTIKYVGTVIATSEGEYIVSAEATGCILRAIWRFFCWWWRRNVIPEIPFGTLAAMTAFFGATGLYVFGKKQRVKK
ncbi:MAG: hypothetical protein ACUVRA_05115 [Candidatus Bathyarchaeaceae archaeon]